MWILKLKSGWLWTKLTSVRIACSDGPCVHDIDFSGYIKDEGIFCLTEILDYLLEIVSAPRNWLVKFRQMKYCNHT
jgi:hypothetical protein